MSDGQTDLSPVSEEVSEESVIYSLAAFGANACFTSYDSKMKLMSDNFCKLDLSVICNMWDLLDDRVKIKIVNINSEKFKAWVNSSSQKA